MHTEYSALDGINKCDKLAEWVAACGMSACAITDHGVLHGIIDFYKAGKKAGINPVLGVEAYLTNNENGIEDNKFKTRDNYHCILVAKNQTGLSNLIYLTNVANQHNFYYKPRINIKSLAEHSEGIIATSSCLGGVVSKQGEYKDKKFYDSDKRARDALMLFSEIFQGNFYAEIQDNPEFWEQMTYNEWLIKQARTNKIPLIITADAHWLKKEDKHIHDLIMAQQLKKSIAEYKAAGDEDGLYYGEGHYIRTPAEMYEAALKYQAEDAFYNTLEVAKQCKVELKLGEYETPIFDPTKEDDYQEFLEWKNNYV